MYNTKDQNPKQRKARTTFENNVKKASKCRNEKYQPSCFSCPEYKT